jgi:hypothetical protein
MYLQKVKSRKTFFLKLLFVGLLKINDENSRIRTGSISQRHRSADPDPHQNVMDPEHWSWLISDLNQDSRQKWQYSRREPHALFPVNKNVSHYELMYVGAGGTQPRCLVLCLVPGLRPPGRLRT